MDQEIRDVFGPIAIGRHGAGVQCRAGRMCGAGAGRSGAAHSTGPGWRGIGGIMRKHPGVQRW